MKLLLSIALIGAVGWISSAAELKVATIDVQRVLSDYYKAQEAMKQLKEKEVSFLKELDGLRLEGRRLFKEVEELKELSVANALSAAERDQKKKAFETRLTNLNTWQIKYDDLKSQREAELQAQLSQANKKVLDDILSATRIVGETQGCNLILNASKVNPVAGTVVFSRNVDDLTDKVLLSLNASQPALIRPANPTRP